MPWFSFRQATSASSFRTHGSRSGSRASSRSFREPCSHGLCGPARELAEKFDHYVDRSFATPEYVEQEIERRIKVLLGSLELKMPFRPARVGKDEVYVEFPLVQQRGTTVAKIIKPFNLNQAEPMRAA